MLEMNSVKILMIDDHPSQIEGYKVILDYNEYGYEVETTACYDCESAYKLILKPELAQYFDVVFLDKNMPPYKDQHIFSGEDLVPVIQKYMPKSKIVILTSSIEAFVLYNMVSKIHPTGLLVKSDFRAEELVEAFNQIMHGEIYYSQSVKGSIDQLLSKKEFLDSYNRQIILLLSQGIKTKSLPQYLNISLSAIEKRKSQIKDYFCIESKGTDEEIVKEARKLGFI